MILSRRVALDGAQLDEADERILIQGIGTENPKGSAGAAARMGRDGSRRTGGNRETVDVVVKFTIRAYGREMEEREAILEAANAWAARALAAGRWLTTSIRPERQIRVRLEEPAMMDNARDATATFKIRFRAYGVPYWVDRDSARAMAQSAVGISGSAALQCPGSARTAADVTMENMSGAAINTVTVKAGDSQISLTGLGMGAGEALIIDHDSEGIMHIQIRSADGKSHRSAMTNRSEGSADDLYIWPGDVQFTFTAQRACRMTAWARGRYL